MIEVGSRVRVPAHTDAWMRGDRYGEVTEVTVTPEWTIAWVKLDKSRRTLQCALDDCTEV